MNEPGLSSAAHAAWAILAYLVANPNAQDTLSGIVEWWLLEHQIRTGTATVEVALAELTASELVLTRSGTDLQVHYRINLDKLNEIAALMARQAE